MALEVLERQTFILKKLIKHCLVSWEGSQPRIASLEGGGALIMSPRGDDHHAASTHPGETTKQPHAVISSSIPFWSRIHLWDNSRLSWRPKRGEKLSFSSSVFCWLIALACSSHSTCAPIGIKSPLSGYSSLFHLIVNVIIKLYIWENAKNVFNSMSSTSAGSQSTKGAISCNKNGIKHLRFIYSSAGNLWDLNRCFKKFNLIYFPFVMQIWVALKRWRGRLQ